MLTLDIFNNDAFSLRELTKVINDLPYKPGRIGELGWFKESGIPTTVAQIEQRGTNFTLVANQPRGVAGQIVRGDKAKLIPVNTTHLPQQWKVLADEVQNIRAFGTADQLKTVQTEVAARMAKCRNNIDVTLEWQRMGAIKGQILDADGTTVILDLFTLMGTTQQTHSIALNTSTTKVRNAIVAGKRKIEAALGGKSYTGIRVLCSPSYFDALISSAAAEKAYDRWMDGQALRTDLRQGFMFGDVIFEEYRGSVNGVDFITDGESYWIPEGVSGDFMVTKFAPADYMETVNTIGLPYYARQELMDMNKGVNGEVQSNPIHLVETPNAILKGTFT